MGMTARTSASAPHECPRLTPSEPPQRGPDGRFLPGNTAALTHGLRRQTDAPDAGGDLKSEIDAFIVATLGDTPGAPVSVRRRILLQYRARLHRRILQLDDALERHGLLDSRRRLRARWLQRLESLINTAKGLDQVLGLDTRTAEPADLALALQRRPREDS